MRGLLLGWKTNYSYYYSNPPLCLTLPPPYLCMNPVCSVLYILQISFDSKRPLRREVPLHNFLITSRYRRISVFFRQRKLYRIQKPKWLKIIKGFVENNCTHIIQILRLFLNIAWTSWFTGIFCQLEICHLHLLQVQQLEQRLLIPLHNREEVEDDFALKP